MRVEREEEGNRGRDGGGGDIGMPYCQIIIPHTGERGAVVTDEHIDHMLPTP